MVADGGGGGKTFGEEIAHALGATDAELLVTLGVALALVDRGHVIPDAQHMVLGTLADERTQLLVGAGGGGLRAAVVALIQLDRGVQPAASGRPAQVAGDARFHRRIHLPDLQR